MKKTVTIKENRTFRRIYSKGRICIHLLLFDCWAGDTLPHYSTAGGPWVLPPRS